MAKPELTVNSHFVFVVGKTKGSLFELIGGSPDLGFVTSAIIAAVGFPSCLFLFYASVRKATAETEEDDRRFLSGDK